jgi:hypothetical protein
MSKINFIKAVTLYNSLWLGENLTFRKIILPSESKYKN